MWWLIMLVGSWFPRLLCFSLSPTFIHTPPSLGFVADDMVNGRMSLRSRMVRRVLGPEEL